MGIEDVHCRGSLTHQDKGFRFNFQIYKTFKMYELEGRNDLIYSENCSRNRRVKILPLFFCPVYVLYMSSVIFWLTICRRFHF